VCLFQALAKGEKMDWIVQKSTELGVAGIIPVITAHCVVKLKDEKREARTDRWERIAREAAKQCGRAVVPRIHPVIDLVSTLANVGAQRVLVPWEGASEPLHTVLHDWQPWADNLHNPTDQPSDFKQIIGDAATMRADRYAMGVVIGPEGGLSGDEVQALVLQGAKPVTLGPRILRTETAAIATLTAVLFAYNEFGGGRSMNEWR
jgi:16S rRNA (uracil1498-N3)-methyltransferase